METGTVRPLSTGEIFDFAAAVQQQLPRDLDPAKVRRYLRQKGEIGKGLRELFARNVAADIDVSWFEAFYTKVFGRAIDLTGIHVPARPDYPAWAIVVPVGITNNEVFDACTRRFGGKTWRYTNDLNTVTDVVSRPDGSYVVWVKETIEADPEMVNISAEEIARRKVNTLALKERMLLEILFHEKTGGHLDVANVTLCSGSRGVDGHVPRAGWRGGRFYVYWYAPRDAAPYLRARVAVS